VAFVTAFLARVSTRAGSFAIELAAFRTRRRVAVVARLAAMNLSIENLVAPEERVARQLVLF
jgi:hypothetical protein